MFKKKEMPSVEEEVDAQPTSWTTRSLVEITLKNQNQATLSGRRFSKAACKDLDENNLFRRRLRQISRLWDVLYRSRFGSWHRARPRVWRCRGPAGVPAGRGGPRGASLPSPRQRHYCRYRCRNCCGRPASRSASRGRSFLPLRSAGPRTPAVCSTLP